jgi:hypothetical protein
VERLAWLRQETPMDLPGLEIGPLDRPVMPRPGSAVLYADHLDSEGLRQKYAAHPMVDKDAIPHIDIVLSETNSLTSALGQRRLHYVIASHVIEHVPNPIGWLSELHDLLVDGGTINLAIPDKRRCFDALRRESTAGEWIDAFLMGHTRPSPSRIFDALSHEVTLEGNISWARTADLSELKLSRTTEHAYRITQQVFDSGEYFDVHCWAFTPESFPTLIRELTAAGLLSLSLGAMTDTVGGEFFVRLRRDDRLSRHELVAGFPAKGDRYRLLPKDFDAGAYYRLNPDVAAAGVDPYDHYIEYGRHEGRSFCMPESIDLAGGRPATQPRQRG